MTENQIHEDLWFDYILEQINTKIKEHQNTLSSTTTKFPKLKVCLPIAEKQVIINALDRVSQEIKMR